MKIKLTEMNDYQINLMYEVSIERFQTNFNDLPLSDKQTVYLDCMKVSDMVIDD